MFKRLFTTIAVVHKNVLKRPQLTGMFKQQPLIKIAATPMKFYSTDAPAPSIDITETNIKGVCKWFNPVTGYGFITRDDGKGDVFVHLRSIDKVNPTAPGLGEGETVVFNVRNTNKGFEAVNVTGPNGEPVTGNNRRRRSNEVNREYVRKNVSGTCKWFNPMKGFGFITSDDGSEIFVHTTNIRVNAQNVLREGDRVRFNIVKDARGKGLEAVEVIM